MARSILKSLKRRKKLPRAFVEAPFLKPLVSNPGMVEKNSALLINPFYVKDPNSSFGKHVLTPTLALTSIAASTPENWKVQIWDENLLQGPPPADPVPEVVGITVHLTFAQRAFELAGWYRQQGSIVVLGGLHVQSCPAECAAHADIIALGEGVQLWGQILNDIERGDYQCRYEGSYRDQPYRNDPSPRRDLIDRRQFLTRTSVIATRGCHNRCNFCYLSTNGMQMPYSMRHIEQIISEIKSEKAKYVVFTDNNLGSKPDFLMSLCRELEKLDIIWSAAVSIDVTDHPDLITAMALAGCTGVFIGFESLNEQSLLNTGKRSPTPDDYKRRVEMLHDVGIQVNGSFVLGFDHDGPDVFEKTMQWIEDAKIESANFQILTPYPATPLFKQMEKQGRLLHKDWSRYDTGHVVFKPVNMTAEQLQEGYEKLYQRHNSLASIWKRRPNDLSAVLPYLASAWLYRNSNWLWYFLIRFNLTNAVWDPLVELNRRRHMRFRRKVRSNPIRSKLIAIPPSV